MRRSGGQYDHKKIEEKWRKKWERDGLYETADAAKGKENYFLLTEFPYPSGNLHLGHWYAFSAPDILARTLRMQGKNVLYPTGFDAFGLPAENAAIKNNLNPKKWTYDNIKRMRAQARSMGTMFDWSREVITADPSYYRWTQWLFLQLFKSGLAYQKDTLVNWCPKDKTVLANEQVVNGKCERCESEVVQKTMVQWNMRITDYADRLVDDLEALDWPSEIKEAQRNWIGRSEGAEIDFPLMLNEGKKKYVILHGYQGSPDAPRFLHWKRELEKAGHEVVIPRLPHTDQPSEKEQVEAALAATSYDENTVLFGHSLGAVVAMKVLEQLKTPIARLVLAGGFVDRNFKDKPRPFDTRFSWQFDRERIRANAQTIQILHDPNDYAISEAQFHRLEDTLGVKGERIAGEMPHFTGEKELPVLRWLRPTLTVFTTRADTLFGGTFLVVAPEHRWVKMALSHRVLTNADEVQRYIDQAAKKTELERLTGERDKTGVKLAGVEALNPASGERIPVYIADYVLEHYGTGAVMGVPAHDERDYAFAKKYDIPMREVVEPLIIQRSGLDAHRDSEPTPERPSVIALVKHWAEDKYLVLRYKSSDARGFVSGGVEDGESPIEAAAREIREESGYTDVEFDRQLGQKIHAKFYSPSKKKNLFCHFTVLLFKLKSDARTAVDPREEAIQEVSWMPSSDIESFINRGEFRVAWDRVIGRSFDGEGIITNSERFDGMHTKEAERAITLAFGMRKKTYKIRDWIISRQRYWGVPIPIVHCSVCGPVAVPDKQLPVLLPAVKDYLPDGSGKSPLAKVSSFVNVKCPQCGEKAERETDTMDTFVDSSWYFLRYLDPHNKKKFSDRKKQDRWMPIDLYSGGAEHTTMHLLYSRFWHKALFDLGLVADSEPYLRRMNHGLILGPDGQKMSKSRGNVIDPDEVVKRLGSDSVRLYLAFIGPYNEVASYPWNPDGVVGVRRFLERAWRLEGLVGGEVPALDAPLHKAIKKVGEDNRAMKFNTAISALMIFLNAAEKEKAVGKDQWRTFLRLLAPFAPHIAEELWSRTGAKKSVHLEKWPSFDADKLHEDTLTIAVQINGKTRAEASVPSGADKREHERAAREAAAGRLDGKKVVRTIVVPGRLVNFVVAD